MLKWMWVGNVPHLQDVSIDYFFTFYETEESLYSAHELMLMNLVTFVFQLGVFNCLHILFLNSVK